MTNEINPIDLRPGASDSSLGTTKPAGARAGEIYKIAFVITELDVGGAEKALVQIVLGLPRDRWNCRVYSLGPWGPLATVLQDAGIPVHCLGAVHLWDAPRVIWALRQALRQFQPHLMQTFLFHANLLGRLAGAWAGVPHIVSGIRVAERRSRLYGWLDYWTNTLVERNVCVSLGVADYCEKTVGLPSSKTVVIPNGVELDRFRREPPVDLQPYQIPPSAPLLLTIGRLERQKGIDLLLQALPAVLETLPETRLVIIGDGPDRSILEALATQLKIRSSILFLGKRSDVPNWLKTADAMVLASRWEGMPNVVLEAMAAGTPVIATEVEGIADLLTNGESGLVVPPENPEALTEAIVQLLDDPPLRLKLSETAQTICSERFTTQKMILSYARFYEELLSGDPEKSDKPTLSKKF